MSKKKELKVTMVFVDQDGNEIDESIDEVINGMSIAQQTKLKLLLAEAITGKRHIAADPRVNYKGSTISYSPKK